VWRFRAREHCGLSDPVTGEEADVVKTVDCECGWQFEGQDAELITAVREHGQSVHNMTVSDEDALAMVKPREQRR
jgi:predicted small metal-binding protein